MKNTEVMRKLNIIIFSCLFLTAGFTQIEKAASLRSVKPPQPDIVNAVVNLGIESVQKNKDGTYNIAIYMLNSEPVAGYQMDIEPDIQVKINTMHGGLSEELGFMMKASENGKVLGFSMQGTTIPVSNSDDLTENILFILNASINTENGKSLEIELTNSVIAGIGGVKLESISESLKFIEQKKEKN